MSTILVVDDEPDVRHAISGILTDAGHQVTAVANEAEAMAAVMQAKVNYVVVDVRLHDAGEDDESGLSLALALQRLKPAIQIILLTRYVKANQVVRATRYYGVVDFIEKTGDWGDRILGAIAAGQPSPSTSTTASRTQYFTSHTDNTRLYLSLIENQAMLVRAHGRFVRGERTQKVLRLDLDRYIRKTEQSRTVSDDERHFQVKDIGLSLWHDLFVEHSEISSMYQRAYPPDTPQQLSIIFETTRDYLQLPLEFTFLELDSEFLVLQHPTTRFITNVTPRRPAISPGFLAAADTLRVLIIASNTTPSIEAVDREAKDLAHFFRTQEFIPAEVKLLLTKEATYDRVRRELQRPDYDIIHYAGHGTFNSKMPGQSKLYFWSQSNRQGEEKEMSAEELKVLLGDSTARLVYLNSCYGAAAAGKILLLDDDFLGLADAAVMAGVPSVLSFRWSVFDESARQLALAFYRSLLSQGRPGLALLHARRALATHRNDPAWLSPILIHQE
ncbi:MAG: CHAT domain-containing protein [Anaerolineales bacterium]|nr:CHAT domain-containing protein [Anaerolineales bacterium]